MKEELIELAQGLEGVEAGQLFGKPSLKMGKAHFACGFQEELVVKIGRDAIAALLPEIGGAQLFDPSGKGRPMKDWLQIPRSHEWRWPELLAQAWEAAR